MVELAIATKTYKTPITHNVKYKNLVRYELVFIQCYPPLNFKK